MLWSEDMGELITVETSSEKILSAVTRRQFQNVSKNGMGKFLITNFHEYIWRKGIAYIYINNFLKRMIHLTSSTSGL
jgi:hypothetical protein